ncbi:hypothetical protein [Candidatus Nitrospira salsa]|nr:MAG: hypothetical protein NPIRA01_12200 [Nitrospirales bacterium]
MPSKHTTPQSSKQRGQAKKLARTSSSRPRQVDAEDIHAISERLDMMLPEVMARIAAVEHVLIEKQVCSLDDLLKARQFINEQESF